MLEKSIKNLHNEILKCKLCKNIFGFEPNPIVFGNYKAKIMQISQAPSYNVYLTGIPFNDKTGQRLLKWYDIPKEKFYNPNIFYITSLAHCFPGRNNKGHKNPPAICAKKWLSKEIKLVENKIYILIGSKVAKYFFPNKSFEYLVFNDQKLFNKPCFVLPHPSPANQKWLKDHKEFFTERLPKIREVLHKIIFSH